MPTELHRSCTRVKYPVDLLISEFLVPFEKNKVMIVEIWYFFVGKVGCVQGISRVFADLLFTFLAEQYIIHL